MQVNKTRFLLLAIAATMLLSGCRKENTSQTVAQTGTTQPEGQMNTFRQATTVTTPADTPASGGTAPAVIDLLKQRVGRGISEIMLTRKGYVTSYNKQTRTPNWVAWTLTRDHTYGRQLRENERFEEDPDVPEPRATFQDYYNSQLDRGHMCPAGDNKWDEEAMTESFLMTNICPQNHGLNKEDWNELEMQCRTWARRYGAVTIVCGPLWEQENPRVIGRNKVMVPSGFFKVVYRELPAPKAIGFVFRNNGRPQPWREQACTVDEVEERAHIDLFPQLPNDVEDLIEAEEVLADW